MGIVDEDIAKVRDAADIVAIVTAYTQLKRVGRRFQGLCPFHSEKTGSFSVNSEDGLYYCFGCGQKGDVITFVREKEQLDFVGAVEFLANKSGIQLRYTSQNESADRKRDSKLKDIAAEAVEFYHERLLTDPGAGTARSYLRTRGYDAELVKKFKIGWAPDDWDQLAKYLGKNHKVSNKELTDAGLGFVNRRGRAQDFFRARILFPIFDARDAAVGFGGRILPENLRKAAKEGKNNFPEPKYKNSSESRIYAKSRTLYGLNWAKQDIVAYDRVVVCEGYTDVVGYHMAGMSQAVATCGTALTEDHVKLLKRFTNKVILSFDADAAGQNAAMRFYEWEKAYDIEVAVVDIPDGSDPGELSLQNPAALVAAVDEAKPFLGFRIDRELRKTNLASVEHKARAAERVLEMVAEHPDPLVRDSYAMEVASRLQIREDLVRRQLKRGKRSGGPSPLQVVASNLTAETNSPEIEALKLLVAKDDVLPDLVSQELFAEPLAQATYEVLADFPAKAAKDEVTLHDLIEEAEPEVGELIHKLSVSPTEAAPLDVAALLWMGYLQDRMEKLVKAGGSESQALTPETIEQHTWMRMQLEQLRVPDSQAEVVQELNQWIESD